MPQTPAAAGTCCDRAAPDPLPVLGRWPFALLAARWGAWAVMVLILLISVGAPGPAAAQDRSPLKLVIFGGQSLAMGAEGRDWVNTVPQFSNSLMLDFDNPAHGARGWATAAVDAATFNGFTPRVEVTQETPATGAMNVLAAAHPGRVFLSLHYGQSGQSLDFIRDNTLQGLFQQLALVKAEVAAQGATLDPNVDLVWIQGQSGSTGDYTAMLSAHQDEVEAEVQRLFGQRFTVTLYTTIVRGYGGKHITGAQFRAIQEDPDILLGSTEIVFNTRFAAGGHAGNPHLTSEGYYMMGAQIGSRILARMAGTPVQPMAVEAVERVGATTHHIHFSGVQGALKEDTSVYALDVFTGAPAHFGIDLYRLNNSRLPGRILSSRIVDPDTVEIVYSRPLSGRYRLWVGRSESTGWTVSGGGAGFGGTTLYDTGQSYSAVDPGNGHRLQAPDFFEFVPQQYFDFQS